MLRRPDHRPRNGRLPMCQERASPPRRPRKSSPVARAPWRRQPPASPPPRESASLRPYLARVTLSLPASENRSPQPRHPEGRQNASSPRSGQNAPPPDPNRMHRHRSAAVRAGAAAPTPPPRPRSPGSARDTNATTRPEARSLHDGAHVRASRASAPLLGARASPRALARRAGARARRAPASRRRRLPELRRRPRRARERHRRRPGPLAAHRRRPLRGDVPARRLRISDRRPPARFTRRRATARRTATPRRYREGLT